MDQHRLHSLLRYEPDTGRFIWLVERNSHGRRIKPGDVAGHTAKSGYVLIGVDGRLYRAHRLAWLYVTGAFPEGPVDHKNGVRADNRWSNLRELTLQENAENIHRAHRDSRTGLLGVSPSFGKFEASITSKGTRHRLGRFEAPEEAHAAYLQAKGELHGAWNG